MLLGQLGRLGHKFDVLRQLMRRVLQHAQQHNLDVRGVSSHVRSDYTSCESFYRNGCYIFIVARDMGIEMNVLDIGHGIPSGHFTHEVFEHEAYAINEWEEENFQEFPGLVVVAVIVVESGRFGKFAMAANLKHDQDVQEVWRSGG